MKKEFSFKNKLVEYAYNEFKKGKKAFIFEEADGTHSIREEFYNTKMSEFFIRYFNILFLITIT